MKSAVLNMVLSSGLTFRGKKKRKKKVLLIKKKKICCGEIDCIPTTSFYTNMCNRNTPLP